MACAPDGTVRAANAAARALFAAEDLPGAPLKELFPREAALPERLAAAGDEAVHVHARRATRVPFTAEVRATAHADGLTRVNASLCRLLDRTPEELLGARDQHLTHPDDRQSDVDAAWRILEGELDTWATEKRFLRPDGSVVWALANLTFLRDDGRRPLCWIGQFQDITARKQAEERWRHQADHDDLTGLVGRRRLLEVLALELTTAASGNGRGALLLLDLDGFKAVNDTRGHDAGDALLGAVASGLRGRVRADDVVGRIGGDEFAVLLPGADAAAGDRVAAALRETIEDLDTAVSASVGVATYGPGRTPAAEALLAEADARMYAAKRCRERAGA